MRFIVIRFARVIVVAMLLAIRILHTHCDAGDMIRIGVSLSLSSEDNSEWGRRTLAGVKIRANEWNRSGKTPKIELVVKDDLMDEETAKRNVQELVENEDVTAIIGPSSSKLALALRDYCKANKMITISPNATHPKIGGEGEWVFRLLFDDDFQAKALAEFAYHNYNMRRSGAIINTFLPYPESVYQAFAESFTKLGGEIIHVERYEWCDDETNVYDFSKILEATFGQQPDLILLPLYSPDIIGILNEALRIDGYSVFCGTDTWDSKILFESGGNRLQDSFFTSGLRLQSYSPEMRHFMKLYNESNEAYAEPSSVLGYDALSLILYAFENNDKPEIARDRLNSLRNHPLAGGVITIDPKRGTFRPVHIYRIAQRGVDFIPVHAATILPDELLD